MAIKKDQPGINEDDLYTEDEVTDEVEVEEDAHAADGEDPAAAEVEDETSEEEEEAPKQRQPGMKGFNKRINELTKKRRDAERERDAARAQAAELERRLREVESFQSDAEVQAIDAKMESMKQRLIAARAADDFDEEVKIQQEIAEAAQRRMVHVARKAVNAAEQGQAANTQQTQEAPKQLVPEVQRLIRSNPWLMSPATPEEQQAVVLARTIANQLEAEGLDPRRDPEYAEQLEAILGEELTERGISVLKYTYNSQKVSSAAQKGNPSQAKPAKAGLAHRGGISSSSSVKGASGPQFKLTAAQKELAKLAGMTDAKYAEYLSAAKE